jgi:hypothetical protein
MKRNKEMRVRRRGAARGAVKNINRKSAAAEIDFDEIRIAAKETKPTYVAWSNRISHPVTGSRELAFEGKFFIHL